MFTPLVHRSSFIFRVLVLLLILWVFGAGLYAYRLEYIDDTYITFQYARNLAHGIADKAMLLGQLKVHSDLLRYRST